VSRSWSTSCLRTTFVAALAACVLATPAVAAGPRNPYSSFNLSGINYGAQQWERDQRAGRVVWPYYNTPSRGRGGAVVPGGDPRPTPRAMRRFRR